MTRSHADIDADLARWTETAARIGRSIEGLTQDAAFLRLKAQSRLGALTGVTKTRGDAAVNAAEQLWTLYLGLDKQLAEAADLRRSNNPFGREDRFAKIDAILMGPSVSVPSEPIGLDQMTFAGAREHPATLAQALSAMQAAFDAARDTVLAASRAWAHSADFAPSADRIRALEAEADALGSARPPALAEAAALVASAKREVDSDPIGADDARAAIAAKIKKADEALASARADLAGARAFLTEAGARLAALAARRDEASRLRAERLAKIKDPAPAAALPPDPAVELRSWLGTLAKTVADRRPRAALVGAKTWLAEVERAIGTFDAGAAEDKRLLDAREDLRGRFSALTAKARARAAEGRLSPETEALFARTRALLFGAPTPLPEAAALLRRCETS
jgi:hypothetical protein